MFMGKKAALKFFIDESVEYRLEQYLEKERFNVLSVRNEFPGAPDKEVINFANSKKRILITNDKDFGQLIFSSGLPHAGVILFRTKNEQVTFKKKRLKQVIEQYYQELQLQNKFVVIEDWRIRIR